MQTLTLVLMESRLTPILPCCSSGGSDPADPGRERVQRLVHHLAVGTARALWHVEGMVGALEQMQRRAATERSDDRFEQVELRESVVRALQEQHRQLHLRKMGGALGRGLSLGMKREAEEGKALHAFQRRLGLRLRGHAPTKGFAARDQGESGAAFRGLRNRGADGCVSDCPRLGPLAAFLHVGKLIAQRRDAASGEADGDDLHRGMDHADARAMGEDKTGARPARPYQEPGNWSRRADLDLEFLGNEFLHCPSIARARRNCNLRWPPVRRPLRARAAELILTIAWYDCRRGWCGNGDRGGI